MATANQPDDPEDKVDIPDIRDGITELLTPLELEAYENWRENLAEWAVTKGKNPTFGKGYSRGSVRTRITRIDRFCEWLFEREGGYTEQLTEEAADEYWYAVLLQADKQLNSARKDANAIQMAFKHQGDEWSIPDSEDVYEEINSTTGTNFTDWFSVDELESIKSASLRAYAVPKRESMTGEEEEEWAAHLANRLRKPRHKLDEGDWERANSYKIPSLVYVSVDVGFRPKEVERAKVDWFDLEEQVMRVAKDESTKNSDYWHCYLSDEATRLLSRWFDERDDRDEYDDEDSVWLTREGNPYSAESLRRPIMQNLMQEAGIDTDQRENGWYMIRRGVGTDIGTSQGLDEVMQQLRIKRVETAKRYVRHDERSMRDYFKDR